MDLANLLCKSAAQDAVTCLVASVIYPSYIVIQSIKWASLRFPVCGLSTILWTLAAYHQLLAAWTAYWRVNWLNAWQTAWLT